MNSKIKILLLLSFIASFATAQYPYTSKITTPDPLPTPVIYDMLGDSKGYLWLATDKGLIKFNSRTFKTILFKNTQLKSVGYIQQDAAGTIWCANFYKQLFYVKNDSAFLFEVLDKAYNNLNNILNIAVNDSSIFVASFNLILEIDKLTHHIKNYLDKKNYQNNSFQYLCLFKNQGYIFNKGTTIFSNKNPQQEYNFSSKFVEARLVADGNKIVGIERGKRARQAFVFDGNAMQKSPNFLVPENTYIYHAIAINPNEYWLCTQNGAYKWNIETGSTELLFPNERVSDIIKDFQGNYWFSTLDNGLFKCPNLNCKNLSTNSILNINNATKILMLPNNNLLVGNTRGKVVEIDNTGKFIKNFETGTNDEIEFLYNDAATNQIFSDGGLMNSKNGKTLTAFDFGKIIDKDINGNILMASFNRCCVATNKFDAVDTTTTPANIPLYKNLACTYLSIQGKVLKKALVLRNTRANWVLANKDKSGFWVAYNDDLYYYKYSGEINIIKDEKNQSIIATHLLQNGNELFVCTPTKGLLILKENKLIKRYTIANGLQSNNTRKTIFNNNTIWVLTDESLETIDYNRNVVQDFFSITGIESLNVSDFIVTSNKVFLATPQGIMCYHQTTELLDEQIKFAQLKIESNGKELVEKTTLPFALNSITVSLDAIHYKAPSKLFFHYRLIGSDSIWKINNAYNNKINYNALAAGNYIFEVFAADINMRYKSKTQYFSFVVAKPFWQTWWFILSTVVAVIAIAFLIGRLWALRFKQQQTIKERILQSKLTAIRSQMNPHFLYNVLNTVQGLVYANKKSEAGEMLGNFSDLMRKTLKESDKAETSLQDEIESLKLYLELEKKRFDKDFAYEIIIDECIDVDDTFIPSMLIQPFAENAIKHGLLHQQGSKKLSINFQQKENKLVVTIDDNGVGREQSAIISKNNKSTSTGFATKAIEERINIFNEMNKQKISMKMIDKKQGTLVELIFVMSM